MSAPYGKSLVQGFDKGRSLISTSFQWKDGDDLQLQNNTVITSKFRFNPLKLGEENRGGKQQRLNDTSKPTQRKQEVLYRTYYVVMLQFVFIVEWILRNSPHMSKIFDAGV